VELYFNNAVFEPGLNATVRRGNRWTNAKGKAFVVKETGNKEAIGAARVVSVLKIPFKDVTNFDVENEHDPKCRTIEGLFDELNSVYKDFSVEDNVCIVYFYFDGVEE